MFSGMRSSYRQYVFVFRPSDSHLQEGLLWIRPGAIYRLIPFKPACLANIQRLVQFSTYVYKSCNAA